MQETQVQSLDQEDPPGEGNVNTLQYSCLGNPMDRGALQATVHRVAKSRTRLHFHFQFSLSCIGEGSGNPLQYSCLGNPMDRGALWATVHGVTKSQTRLSDFTFPLRQRGILIWCFQLLRALTIWHHFKTSS